MGAKTNTKYLTVQLNLSPELDLTHLIDYTKTESPQVQPMLASRAMPTPKPLKTRIEFGPSFQKSVQLESGFFAGAHNLRNHFEDTFKNPYRADSDRFCWDYWSIPGQYRLLRTPAQSFFPEKQFQPFLSALLSFGRTHLGCQMISHPWLSAYVDGCHQNLHSDVPHGPFSFVYSLTPWQTRSFTGGETLIAKPKLLRYFSEIQAQASDEEKDLIASVPPKFNQLTVFDPRFPHGVRPVQGVETLLDSRLVIHGWFTEPRPMLHGSLGFKKILKPMDQFAESIMSALSSTGEHSGLLTLRLTIAASGQIEKIRILTANLLNPLGHPIPKATLCDLLDAAKIEFPKSRAKTTLTLPIEILK